MFRELITFFGPPVLASSASLGLSKCAQQVHQWQEGLNDESWKKTALKAAKLGLLALAGLTLVAGLGLSGTWIWLGVPFLASDWAMLGLFLTSAGVVGLGISGLAAYEQVKCYKNFIKVL